MKYIIIMGSTGIGFLNTFVYFAGHTSNAVDMALITTLGPIILIILAHFFTHEKISSSQIYSAFFVIVGICLVLFGRPKK